MHGMPRDHGHARLESASEVVDERTRQDGREGGSIAVAETWWWTAVRAHYDLKTKSAPEIAAEYALFAACAARWRMPPP